jgi:hypothetical protein
MACEFTRRDWADVLGEVEIGEVGFEPGGVRRLKHKHLAAVPGGVRAVQLAGLDVERRAGQVLLALVALL